MSALAAHAAPPAPPQEPVIYDTAPDACQSEDFTIYFERGVSDLGDQAEAVLDAVTEDFRHCEFHQIEVAGYADATGSHRINQIVSNKRAYSVMDGLEARGIKAEHVAMMATGEARAMTANGFAEPLNRKVVVRLVPIASMQES